MSDCLFCRIARKEISANVVYEDESVLAFHDINPQAPVHVVIIPKAHTDTMNTAAPEVYPSLFAAVSTVAEKLGIRESGYRVVINCGANSGMMVSHLHLHLLGGKKLSNTLC